LTGATTLTVAPAEVDPFVRELDEVAVRAEAFPRGAVEALRAVLEALLTGELAPPERDCALRTMALLAQHSS